VKHCKKLALSLDPDIDLNQSRVLEKHVLGKHGKIEGVDDYSLIRRYITRRVVSKFKEAIPSTLHPYISGVTLTEITLLAPHVHTREQCVINFYQTAHDDVTVFYEGEIQQDDSWTLDNGHGYFLINPNLVHSVESFVAKAGDVWLLNTRQPHSVEGAGDTRNGNNRYNPIRDEKRLLVQAFCDLPFEEAVGFFND
jgi:hypothetical protein